MFNFLAKEEFSTASYKDAGQSFKSIITKFAQNMYLPLRKNQLNFETSKLHRRTKKVLKRFIV